MASIQFVEFALQGDPARAKSTAIQALESRKFKMTWTDEWTGFAERGSKIANALLGAFAQYFKVGLSVRSAEGGTSIVRVEKTSKGMMGGAIGMARTNKNMNSLRDELQATFANAGVLQGTNEG